eukprot:scaffold4390_cov264-Pinguiococcus_pyrenoidosus.AAC.11
MDRDDASSDGEEKASNASFDPRERRDSEEMDGGVLDGKPQPEDMEQDRLDFSSLRPMVRVGLQNLFDTGKIAEGQLFQDNVDGLGVLDDATALGLLTVLQSVPSEDFQSIGSPDVFLRVVLHIARSLQVAPALRP